MARSRGAAAVTLIYGIAEAFADQLTSDVSSRMSYVEARADSAKDRARIAANRLCSVVHVLDPWDAAEWRDTVSAVASIETVRLVNTHAMPVDRFVQCGGCGRRQANRCTSSQQCQFCRAPFEEGLESPAVAEHGFDAVVALLKEGVERLRERGKQLTVENTFEPPELMRDILGALPLDVGFTLDVGHALIWGDQLAYLDMLGHRLCHLHLHDNHGGFGEQHDEHLSPGLGAAPWSALAAALVALRSKGTATFESAPEPEWIDSWERDLSAARSK